MEKKSGEKEMRRIKIPQCRKCGACCIRPEDNEFYCGATPEDLKSFSRGFIKKNVSAGGLLRTKWMMTETGPYKGIGFCACVALRGSLMNGVSCRIYKNRPSVCRFFKRGGYHCRAAIIETKESIQELFW